MESENLVSVRVWGDFACFTRPEMKVERVSYPVMTPSAARGILEAIFWEPQMHYWIDAVRVVKKGGWMSFRRNEVTAKLSLDSAQTWMKAPEKVSPIQAGGGAADGTQRNMLALRDVEYIITAQVFLTELGEKAGQNTRKYVEEIKRRAAQGKCFHRPALGMREFAADFDHEPDPQAALERRAAEQGKNWRTLWPDEDLGLMLYDVFSFAEQQHGFRWLCEGTHAQVSPAALPSVETLAGKKKRVVPTPRYEGVALKPRAYFFHAKIENSRLNCHPDRVRFVREPGEEV